MTAPSRIRQEEVHFTVTYDGPDVALGRMDAHALGAAMLSMAQLIDAAAGLTYGAGAKVDTEIAADFRRGSFAFGVIVAADLHAIANQLLSSISIDDLLHILGVTGGGGVIGLGLWLRNRRIRRVEPISGSQNVTVTASDGGQTVAHGHTVMLFNNSTVRMHLNEVVSPLKKEGISEFRSGDGGQTAVVVRAEEAEYFEPPPPSGEILSDRVYEGELVQLMSLTFLPGRKWRFRMADGTTFHSTVDDAFTAQVLRHEVEFGAGDALEVDLHVIVTREATGLLRASREIVRVRSRIPGAATQTSLLLDGQSDADGEPEESRRLLPPSTD